MRSPNARSPVNTKRAPERHAAIAIAIQIATATKAATSNSITRPVGYIGAVCAGQTAVTN